MLEVSHSSISDHKTNGNREVYHSQVLVEVSSMPQRFTQRGQPEVQTERGTGPKAQALHGSMGAVF